MIAPVFIIKPIHVCCRYDEISEEAIEIFISYLSSTTQWHRSAARLRGPTNRKVKRSIDEYVVDALWTYSHGYMSHPNLIPPYNGTW
jgi:hypothetical protein